MGLTQGVTGLDADFTDCDIIFPRRLVLVEGQLHLVRVHSTDTKSDYCETGIILRGHVFNLRFNLTKLFGYMLTNLNKPKA